MVESAEMSQASCVLIELTNGDLKAFQFYDTDLAKRCWRECREEWNAGRNLVIYLRKTRCGPPSVMYHGDEVAHLELASREDATQRGAICKDAVVFG
jgi:hypothetical protein